MPQTIVTFLVVALSTTAATAQPSTSQAPQAAFDLSQPPYLSEQLIRKAVRDTIADDARLAVATTTTASASATATLAGAGSSTTFGAATPTMEQIMTAAFEQAKVGDCLHGDALKLQPAHIGPVAVVGPYALPWWVTAVLRGKCR